MKGASLQSSETLSHGCCLRLVTLFQSPHLHTYKTRCPYNPLPQGTCRGRPLPPVAVKRSWSGILGDQHTEIQSRVQQIGERLNACTTQNHLSGTPSERSPLGQITVSDEQPQMEQLGFLGGRGKGGHNIRIRQLHAVS